MDTVKGIWQPRWGILLALDEDDETQAELAERMGIDPSTLSRIINGERKKVGLDEWQRIAEAQDRPLTWYINGPGRPATVGARENSGLHARLIPFPVIGRSTQSSPLLASGF